MKTEFLKISQMQLKKWARLSDAKFRSEEGIFLAEGVKVVEELLRSDWNVESLLVLPEKTRDKEKIDSLIQSRPDCAAYELSRSQWQKIGQDKEPEGLMAVVSIKAEATLSDCWNSAEDNLLVLHEIRNPRNLGALMRSSQWFGFNCLILSVNCVDYSHPKAVRASMGSLFHLTIVSDVDLTVALPRIKETYYLVGSDVREGVAPHPLARKAALLLGSESHGLPEGLLAFAHERWRIPGKAQADSLSLPQAAAIMMYECARSGS